MAFYSPLRYPGGKGKLAPYISGIIDVNAFHRHTYVEPYAGGTGVALYLLLNNKVPKIIINDVNFHIHAFWHVVLYETDQLCTYIENTPVTMQTWHEQKNIYAQGDAVSFLQAAFATFFLNRANRSGILSGGVIGGQAQTGKYKIDARYNKTALIKRIQDIAARKDSITLYNEDALILLQKLRLFREEKFFFYFDPPYFEKGCLLYQNSYNGQNHWDLAVEIKKLSHPWLVTYDRQDEIFEMYDGAAFTKFSIGYSAHVTRPRGLEVMFYKNLQLPKLPLNSASQTKSKA